MNEHKLESLAQIILGDSNDLNDILEVFSECSHSSMDGNETLDALEQHLETKFSEFYPNFSDWRELADKISFMV